VAPSCTDPSETLLSRRWPYFVILALLLAELLSLGVGGTFASYTAETNNPGTSLGTGTLTLATTNNSVTCNSYTASDNSNTGCGSLTLSGQLYPGQSVTTAITVKNTGSLPGALSTFSLSGCSPALLCGEAQFFLEETNSSGGSPNCYYPTPTTGVPCAFSSSDTLSDFANNTYYDSADALALGTVPAVTTEYFVLGFYLPTFSSATVGNQYQATSTTLDLSWFMSQG
jgi:hypothetical protein